MTDIKLFEKWVKKSLNDIFYFQSLEDEIIALDGFTAFRIKRSKKDYMNVLKQQTFQELNEDFRVTSRRIEKKESIDITESFDLNKKEIITDTRLYYEGEMHKNLKVLKTSNDYIFVDEKLLNVVNIYNYDLYGSTPVKPIVLHSKEVDVLILPVRLCVFPYEINKI